MRLRLKEIAAHAGVSEATVSRVLNGRRGVASDTRRKVEHAVEALGYEQGGGERGLVGIVVPELSNPIFPAFAQAIEQRLTGHGFTSLVCTTTLEGRQEDDYVSTLLELRVDGIVFVSGIHANTTADAERYRRLIARGLPIVLINGPIEGLRACFLSTDDTEAARLAVEHLVGLGHQRIGLLVGPERFTPARRKIDGFTKAVTAAFGSCDPGTIMQGMFSLEAGQRATGELLAADATAVVCGSDIMALGAILAARQRGLTVPKDVSVVGFDDSQILAFTDPALTTVRQPVDAMASATVRALVEAIRLDITHPGEYLFLPELIVRDSTAAAPLRRRSSKSRQPVTAAT